MKWIRNLLPQSNEKKWKKKYFELEQNLNVMINSKALPVYDELQKKIDYIEVLEKEVAHWKHLALTFKRYH